MTEDPEFLKPPEIDRAGSAVCAINLLSTIKQMLREVGPILAGNAGNYRFFHVSISRIE
jgi:hypothetical protein